MRHLREVLTEEDAQTTAEYALVILGAAAVAGALIAWAGGTDVIKSFFNKIFQQLMGSLG
jgi:Flp pilus assembly pilin Flp